MTDNIAKIAAGLSEAQRRAMLWLSEEPQAWPKGSTVALYCLANWTSGNPEKKAVLHAKICKVAYQPNRRISDPTLWVITPVGLAVRNYLKERTDGQ